MSVSPATGLQRAMSHATAAAPTVLTWVDFRRLRRFELFAELRDAELAEIARCAREQTLAAETVVIRQGQVGEDVYLLEEGLINVYRERRGRIEALGLIHAPTVFGEMAIVTPELIRTASVRAMTDLQVLSIRVSDMLLFIRRYPLLRAKLQEILYRRGYRD